MSIARSPFLASIVFALSIPCVAQQPDNSSQNKGQTITAQSQPNTRSDLDLAAQVRKAIIADKGLSMYAHNVKVIVANGSVTLKGPVKSEEEKKKVASDASSVAGAGTLTNQLTVKQ